MSNRKTVTVYAKDKFKNTMYFKAVALENLSIQQRLQKLST